MHNDSDLNIVNKGYMNALKPGNVNLTPMYGLIKIAGNDASKFLQGQLTCNVDTLTSQATLAAHCNPQGRVISLFYIFKSTDAYFLCLPRDMISIAINALKKYAVFFKVTIEPIDSLFTIIGYSQAIDTTLSEQAIGRISLSAGNRLILISDAAAPENSIQDFEWKAQDLLEKIPSVYAATSGQFLPHELDLPSLGAIDFNKGCYTGQEIIARMHYRGKVKVTLRCGEVNTNQPPVLGSDIYHQKDDVAGSIVETCFLNENQYLVLLTVNENKIDSLFLNNDMNKPLHIIT